MGRDNKTINPESFDAAKAQVAIEADQKRRSELCAAECEAAMKRHNCELQFVEVRTNSEVTQRVFVYVAK